MHILILITQLPTSKPVKYNPWETFYKVILVQVSIRYDCLYPLSRSGYVRDIYGICTGYGFSGGGILLPCARRASGVKLVYGKMVYSCFLAFLIHVLDGPNHKKVYLHIENS